MSEGFLEQMARSSAARVAHAKARLHERDLRALAAGSPEPVPLALHEAGFDIIAEMKLRSPAAGKLASDSESEATARRVGGYARAGAAAVSVLTEPSRFDGSMEHLEDAARALRPLRVPAMRKDFLLDPYQVLEARAAGAGGVLIILRMLADEQIEALLDCARDMSLFALLEAFDSADIARAHDIVDARQSTRGQAQARILVGVNCRDLVTLQVVPARLLELAALLPPSVPRVAESGVGSGADAARIARAGYDLALVGSALMTGGDPESLLRELLAAGRHAREQGD
jgi:indole-3-glycerol phosphate synthase